MLPSSRHFLALAALFCAATATAAPEQPGAAAPAKPAAHEQSQVRAFETIEGDLDRFVLVDHEGVKRRLASDVLQDHLVVVDFLFTSCSTVCPLTSALLADFRATLQGELAKKVRFVSISTDPTVDTPPRLRSYGDAFGLDERWVLLTGDKPTMDAVLKKFDVYTTNPEDHPQLTLVGDAASGKFVRLFGAPEPQKVLAILERLSAQRSAQHKGGSDT